MASQTMVWAQSMLGQTLKGQYRVEGILGEGAMGVVFRGVNLAMGKHLAVKMMRKETFDTPDAVERFNREARVWSQLNHPTITQVFDFGLHEGQPFLVMELVEGADLSDVLKNEGPLEPLRAVKLMRQLASALEEAHRLGVVHRDIKPQNMKLLRYQPGGKMVLKVLDFGMAKQVGKADQRLTAPGILVGTPKYVAPEQVTENPVIDGRTDLYASGVLFYELLTGNAPFLGSPHEVLFAHLGTPPKPLPDSIPAIVSDVVMRLLKKRPDERYPNAAALEQALEECEHVLRAGAAPAFSSGMYPPVNVSGANFVPLSPSAISAGAAIGVPSAQSLRGAAAALIPPSSTSGKTNRAPSAQSNRQVTAAPRSQVSGPQSGPGAPPAPSSVSARSQPAAAPSTRSQNSGQLQAPSQPSNPSGQPARGGGGRFVLGTLAVLLGFASAGGLYGMQHYLPMQRLVAEWVPAYHVPQDEEVQRALRELEQARDARKWAEVLRGVQFLEQRYGGTLLPEQTQALGTLRAKAQLEQPMQEIYERIVASSTRTDPEEVVRLHDQLVGDSIYRALAQPYYASAVESYVAIHLSQAEELRLAGRCPEYLTEVQKMLNAVPGHPQARAAERKECPPSPAELAPAPGTAPDGAAAPAPGPATPEGEAAPTGGKGGGGNKSGTHAGTGRPALPEPPPPTE